MILTILDQASNLKRAAVASTLSTSTLQSSATSLPQLNMSTNSTSSLNTTSSSSSPTNLGLALGLGLPLGIIGLLVFILAFWTSFGENDSPCSCFSGKRKAVSDLQKREKWERKREKAKKKREKEEKKEKEKEEKREKAIAEGGVVETEGIGMG